MDKQSRKSSGFTILTNYLIYLNYVPLFPSSVQFEEKKHIINNNYSILSYIKVQIMLHFDVENVQFQ